MVFLKVQLSDDAHVITQKDDGSFEYTISSEEDGSHRVARTSKNLAAIYTALFLQICHDDAVILSENAEGSRTAHELLTTSLEGVFLYVKQRTLL